MRLAVCALADLDGGLAAHRPDGVVSLLSPTQEPPSIAGGAPRLALRFHDIAEPTEGLSAMSPDQAAELLAFGAGFGEGATLLVHCWMGISRSPAAAFALACAAAPTRDETEIAQALRLASPTATPNPRLVALADEQLGRRGRMRRAIAALGRGADAASAAPFVLAV